MPLTRLKGSVGRGRYGTCVFVKRDVVDAILAARNGNGASESPGILDAGHKPAETANDAGHGSASGTQGDGRRAAEHGEAEIDLEALRATLPPFNSREWVSNKEAAALDGFCTRTLSVYPHRTPRPQPLLPLASQARFATVPHLGQQYRVPEYAIA